MYCSSAKRKNSLKTNFRGDKTVQIAYFVSSKLRKSVTCEIEVVQAKIVKLSNFHIVNYNSVKTLIIFRSELISRKNQGFSMKSNESNLCFRQKLPRSWSSGWSAPNANAVCKSPSNVPSISNLEVTKNARVK